MKLVLPLRTWLTLSHLVVLTLPIVAVLATGALGRDLRRQTRAEVAHQATLIALLVSSEVEHAREQDPQASIATIADRLNPRLAWVKGETLAGFQITDAEATVVASSGKSVGHSLVGDPEVEAALAGQTGVVIRPRANRTPAPLSSVSRRARVRVFVARPIRLGDEILGATVVSRTPREEIQALYHMAPRMTAGATIAVCFTLALALLASYVLTRSLKQLAGASNQIADGSVVSTALMERPQVSHVREVSALAGAVSTMAERLQARLSYIAEFAGNVSHEFKTPLSTLRGTIELLVDDAEMPPEQRTRFLTNALDELDRLDRLVSGLLALARAEEGRDYQPVSLQDVMDSVADRHTGLVLQGTADWVMGSASQLEAVLSNLVHNATQHGGHEVTVQVVGWQTPDETGFDVIDDGTGISEANLHQVFHRFFTTDRAAGGTGLGLALVDAVCRAHGGSVTVQSEPGCTQFRIRLPRIANQPN